MAAADAGAYGEAPPRLLVWAWRSSQWGLPYPGTWLDQPAGLISKMSYLQNVYQAHKGFFNSGNLANWSKANPQLHDIVADVLRMRGEIN